MFVFLEYKNEGSTGCVDFGYSQWDLLAVVLDHTQEIRAVWWTAMNRLSPTLREASDVRLLFWCPGCNMAHHIQHGEGPGPRWGWNGDINKPTFTPSILVTGRDLTDKGKADFEAWHTSGCPIPATGFESAPSVCHSFVTDGRIQFLGDCTHAMAGQTVDLPEWDKA